MGMIRCLTLGLIFFASTNAFGYGHEGHQAIAEMASANLNPSARQAIVRILGNSDLAAIATWPDQLKQAKKRKGPLANDSEAQAFNAAFPFNGQWHFLNLPLGTKAYIDDGKFSDVDDIVHAINECIDILESPPGKKAKFEKKQALRFLVHLVGDIHQPLHVGTGYYNLAGPVPVLIENPDQAYRHQDDEGANYLRYGDSHFSQLHEYWDDTLVEHVAHTGSYKKLADVLQARAKPSAWKNTGDYHHWAEQWATDSVHEARAAYAGIVFKSAEVKRNGKLKLIHVRLPENYENQQSTRAADQLTKAGAHLGNLLNNIHWQ
jgi:hypothetical protein